MVAPYLTSTTLPVLRLTLDTAMAKEKDNKTVDWRKGQPTNEPIAIAKAIAALSADENNNGTMGCFLLYSRNRERSYMLRRQLL
jgi:hypothetical protein